MAVVAPSAGLAGRFPRRTERGITALRALGYQVRVMPHARESRSWVSAGVEERRADLEQAFLDPGVAAVLPTIGGNHSAQLLAGLDMELIAAHPKVLCGYSDITSLLNGIHVATGLVTFYGPALLPQFGEYPEPLAETVTAFQRAVTRPRPLGQVPEWDHVVDEFCDWGDDVRRPRHVGRTAGRRLLRAGSATGRLLCGCLPTLRHLIGTPWQPDFTDAILVLDLPDDGYDVRELDADLWHLRNAGLLGQVAALLVGRMARVTDEERTRMDAVIREVCAPFDFPVVSNFECGHADPCLTLPIGCRAALCDSVLTVLEPGVS
ncbi:S66 family peptidase [Streptantibioticus silvisoli]|uniref:LD-carboxypeptidase n=1 Tax=Streptantibioticus silvisoli TaxID=2705255 RepID=A0ABT6VSZ5_9ACTN|nr:S66 peptidase family protein [Streptantibioticus silvisoli]MDI5961598.1 LD-carboxypeptidase [Streptantibioticus silvisoli]